MLFRSSLSTSSGVEYLQRAEGGISNLNLNAADKDPSCKDNSYLPALYLAIHRNGAVNKASLSASVFAENPHMKLIVLMACVAVLMSVVTVIVKKREKNMQN